MILLPRKLCKVQTEIMTRDARSFTRNNHTKSCRWPVSRLHKLGWQETHTFQKKLLKNSATSVNIIGDSIATDLRIYRYRTFLKILLTWESVLIVSKMSYGERRTFVWNTQHCLWLCTVVQIMWTKDNQKTLPLESWKLLKPLWRIIQKLPSLLACYQGARRTLFSAQKLMKQTRYWKRKAKTSRKHTLLIRMTTESGAIWYYMKT